MRRGAVTDEDADEIGERGQGSGHRTGVDRAASWRHRGSLRAGRHLIAKLSGPSNKRPAPSERIAVDIGRGGLGPEAGACPGTDGSRGVRALGSRRVLTVPTSAVRMRHTDRGGGPKTAGQNADSQPGAHSEWLDPAWSTAATCAA
ncbi:hypothetical protein CG716_29130 [Mycolicibacterium sphagni]|uniref:Uncharacterized protein n=1 Tax=Mycolicibacterium sphagni TaxID=1786 RepID=A0A255D4Z3_9MYCO|nr:hypothetical protein CG716_29130 [Mycolicibacterium sphagni]